MSDVLVLDTGFRHLDEILGGLRSGGMYLIAGEEKSGKTSLVLNIAKNIVEAGHSLFYGSTELSEPEVKEYFTQMGNPTFVDSNPGFIYQDLFESGLKNHIRLLEETITRGDVRVAIIDNITSYRDETLLEKGEWQRIAQAGDSYRRIARKHNVVLIAVVHLNQGTRINELPKSVKELIKKNKPGSIFEESVSVYRRPTITDIKGGSGYRSQTKGQILLWRPYQGFALTEYNSLGSIIVENNRSGPCGEVRVKFDGSKKTFTEIEPLATYESAKELFNKPYKENE